MNSKMKLDIRVLLAVVFLHLLSSQAKSQTRSFYSLFPGISVSAPVSDKLEVNLSAYAQYNTFGREYEGIFFPAAFNYVDFQVGGVYKYNQHIHYAAAWYYRITEPGRNSTSFENRFWQQVSFISRLQNLRFRNRLRIEQRMISRAGKTDPLRWRLRYQTGFEIPLQGEKTDIREFYLILLNEAYFSLNKPRSAFYGENWISVFPGYRISAKSRLEVGPVWQLQIRNAEKEKNSLFHLQVNLIIQTNFARKND
jgi:hypothetical protein